MGGNDPSHGLTGSVAVPLPPLVLVCTPFDWKIAPYHNDQVVSLFSILCVAVELDITEFERQELGRLGMPQGMVMRHRPAHFARKSVLLVRLSTLPVLL